MCYLDHLRTYLHSLPSLSIDDNNPLDMEEIPVSNPKYKLISHHLCPFVQRAAIALNEKNIPFERVNIDLANKPEWFLELSPLGKVPVLVVDDKDVLFESSVIAQYLDEVTGGELLDTDPLVRARQKAWMEYASSLIGVVGQLYNAKTRGAFEVARHTLVDRFRTLEENLGEGPFFSGSQFTLVDAAFAPVFRYFDVIEQLVDVDLFPDVSRVADWRAALSARPSVIDAVAEDYPERLLAFFSKRDSIIGKAAHARLNDTHQAVA